MSVFCPGRHRSLPESFLLVASLVLLLFVMPLTALAESQDSIDTLRQMGNVFAQISENASPAVVGIEAEKSVPTTMRDWPFHDPSFEDDFFERFFRRDFPKQRSPQPKQRQMAKGSGFIISADGYILTNNHLVGQADKVIVKLKGAEPQEAEIIGTDPESDVAVVKIDGDNLPYLELADSDELKVGNWVLAIGNPFGLDHTVTAGIVSAKGRRGIGLADYEDFIQTDAAINPGNSGGPLLNLDGKVVGINTAIIGSMGNIGIGLAIPINMAKNVHQQIVDSGSVVRGYLGVYMSELTPALAEAFGVEGTKGVAIAQVIEDSPAEKAGLKHNDIIVELEGRAVEKANELQNEVAALKPGTEVEIVVLRNGKREKFTVELSERPSEGQITAERSDILDTLGMAVQELTDDLAARFGYEGLDGVIVSQVEPYSPVARVGITPGMLIQEVNRTKVKNKSEFYEAVTKAPDQEKIVLLVNNGQFSQFVVVRVPEKKQQ